MVVTQAALKIYRLFESPRTRLEIDDARATSGTRVSSI